MQINEFDKQVTQADIDQLEVFADKIFSKVGIDVNFTRHFLDRVNDERNGKPISMSELTRLFKQEQKRWGKKIAQLGPDEEAVMKDLQTDINLPFALRWDEKNNELDLIAKTVMRKKNFKTPNPEFPVEGKADLAKAAVKLAGKAGGKLFKSGAAKAGASKGNQKLAKKAGKLAGQAAAYAAGEYAVNKLTKKNKELQQQQEDVDPVDMAAAAGVAGVAGSMAGRTMGKNLAKDPLGQKPYLDRMARLAKRKTPPKGPNANVNNKPATGNAPKLPGVTRGAGGGGMGVSPKRVAGGARRIEPPLRNPFNMFNESGEIDNALFEDWYNNYYKPVRDKFPQVGNAIKNAGGNPFSKRSIQDIIKRNPNIVKQAGDIAKKYANLPDPIARFGASVAGVPKDQVDFGLNMRSKFKKEYPKAWNDVTQGNVKGALNRLGIATESLPPHLAKHFDKDGDAVKGSWKDGKWTADKKQPKKVKYTVKDVTPKGYGPLDEDFGSVPPLAELIVMAVVAQTTVGALKAAFKAAVTTGKGIQKLNQLRKKAQGIGQGVADYVMPESLEEATREELLSQLKDRQTQKFYQAALDALHKLVSAKGGRQSVGGYAFDIARAFNGIDGRELEKMYSELHEKVNVIRQSNPLDVLDTLSTRKDNIVHPIKFYDGDVLKVSVDQARRFMNAYYKMDDDKREIIDRYIKTKNGFQQAIKSLEVRENAFDLLSAALDWKKDK